MKEPTGGAAVFLDRDGTILRDVGYLSSREQMEILPRVPEAIRLLKEKGYKIIVVTNQSGVARGRLSEDELKQIHEELRTRLALAGAVAGRFILLSSSSFGRSGPVPGRVRLPQA
ncbi:MAG TPA: HAD-IIIA family hydrolase [Candidatus Acidoferrales bacterium]|nr:HAD-IIIA family hydrolase [Candidatus Acidoferrales bacterium]